MHFLDVQDKTLIWLVFVTSLLQPLQLPEYLRESDSRIRVQKH